VLDNTSLGRVCSRLKVILLTAVILVFFPIIGSALYIGAGFVWLRERVGLRSHRSVGFLFASAYAAIAAILGCRLFQGHLAPRFTGIYLLGIVFTAYRFTWRSAAYLFAIALAVSAWVQPPASGWHWLVSFAAASVFSIVVAARLKTVPVHAGMGG